MTADTPEKCSRCGGNIPKDAPEGICPKCTFEQALDADTGERESGLGASVSTKSNSVNSSGKIGQNRVLRIAPIIIFACAAAFTIGRTVWSQTHLRPAIFVDDKLKVVFDSHQYGISAGHNVVAVNSVPVASLEQLYAEYDKGTPGSVDLFFRLGNQPETEVNVTWMQTSPPLTGSISTEGIPEDESLRLLLGLNQGERVVAINGILLNSLSNTMLRDVPGHSNREVIYLTRFSLASGDGQNREIVVYEYTWRIFWARLLAGLAFGTIAVSAFFLRSDTRSSFGFLVFCLHLGLFWFARSIPSWYRTDAENALFYLLQCFLPLSAILFVITFTPLRSLVVHFKRWLLPTGIGCLALLLGNFALAPKLGAYGFLDRRLFQAWAIVMLAILLLTFLSDLWIRARKLRLSPTDRQRATLIRIAIILGFLPSSIYMTLVPTYDPSFQYLVPMELTIVVFPLLIAYAIVRHNLLRLDELVIDSLLFTLIVFGLTATYSAGVAFLLPLTQQLVPESDNWFRSALVTGALLVAIPLQGWTRKRLTVRLMGPTFDLTRFLELIHEDEVRTLNTGDYSQNVVRAIGELANTPTVALLTKTGHEKLDWVLSASTSLPPISDPNTSCRELLEILEESQAEIHRDQLIENFPRFGGIKTALEELDSLGVSMVYPLVSGNRVIGALAVGDKDAKRNYPEPELRALRAIARHVGTALGSLITQESVRNRRIADLYPACPERIGGYSIEAVAGEGGMSYVYRASKDGQYYAIKVANRAVQADEILMERFHREASVLQRLNHPNIVKVTEVGWHGPEPFIVLEYLERGTLQELVKDVGKMEVGKVLDVALQVAQGLAAAEKIGVIHRDIKPGNLFLANDGKVKIGDFGLAQLADRTSITQTGQVFGTPAYLSPEIMLGKKTTAQSDQYSLGITLFVLLTGKQPFEGEDAESVLYARLNSQVPDPAEHVEGLSSETRTLIQTLLAREPEKRFASYDDLIDSIRNCLSGCSG